MSEMNKEEFPIAILKLSKDLGLRVEKLKPIHAAQLQRIFKPGTEHIAEYFVWGKDAFKWSTKDCLFWIQDLIHEAAPSENYVFFKGKDLIGFGALGAYITGMGPIEDSKHIQMAYWVGKDHLKRGYGDRIVRIMEAIVFLYRFYDYMHLIHDSSNHKTAHMAQRLGYKFEDYYDAEIKARRESGLYYSWVKVNPFMSDVRTKIVPSQTRNLIRTSD